MTDCPVIEMHFPHIQPFVRHARIIPLNPELPLVTKMIYDYRFAYVYSGQGVIEIDEIPYHCKKGDLFFWGPCTKYTIIADIKDPIVILNIWICTII